jgi:hypothetical protein
MKGIQAMSRITSPRKPVLLPEDPEPKMPAATTQPARARINLNNAWCEALFASPLQPSDSPTVGVAAEAANWTLRQLGVHGCAGRMAQEFGDHPDAAASRMRWARQLAQAAHSGR